MNQKIIVVILITVIVALAGVVGYFMLNGNQQLIPVEKKHVFNKVGQEYQKANNQISEGKETLSDNNMVESVPKNNNQNNLKEFSDAEFGIEFKYPSNYVIHNKSRQTKYGKLEELWLADNSSIIESEKNHKPINYSFVIHKTDYPLPAIPGNKNKFENLPIKTLNGLKYRVLESHSDRNINYYSIKHKDKYYTFENIVSSVEAGKFKVLRDIMGTVEFIGTSIKK